MSSRAETIHPLAFRTRPKKLDDIFGQEHLTGKKSILYRYIISDNIPSMILWGPPGTGKTSVARVISEMTGSIFRRILATRSGVAELRKIMNQAQAEFKKGRRTILFIDEIHRFSKVQQDFLLMWVETGIAVLIGSTTENPRFSIIPALMSRIMLFSTRALDNEALDEVLRYILNHVDSGLPAGFFISRDLSDYLKRASGGDARKFINLIEMSASFFSVEKRLPEIDDIKDFVLENVSNSIDTNLKDTHYDCLSAFIKSMRGSDPDAALYWACRVINLGEDPVILFRRMLIFASEDIGNADPDAAVLSNSIFNTYKNIGMPEGIIPLGQLIVYLSLAPKSNSSCTAVNEALSFVKNSKLYPVPEHLKNYPAEKSAEYKYPHDFSGFVSQSYLDESIKGIRFFTPKKIGFEEQYIRILNRYWKDIKGEIK